MIKAIIFDMGGVVCEGKLESALEKIANKLKINKEEFFDLFYLHKNDLQTGKMKVSQFCNMLKDRYKIKQDIIPIWRGAYLEVFSLNTQLLDYIEKLRRNHKIALITNTSDLHVEINKERNAFKYFDETFVSCELGVAKPNKKVFKVILRKLKSKAEECVFIDDRLEHLEAPKQMGFNVIHFKNNSQLTEELKNLDVHPNTPARDPQGLALQTASYVLLTYLLPLL